MSASTDPAVWATNDELPRYAKEAGQSLGKAAAECAQWATEHPDESTMDVLDAYCWKIHDIAR
jgi:hypothetical protein